MSERARGFESHSLRSGKHHEFGYMMLSFIILPGAALNYNKNRKNLKIGKKYWTKSNLSCILIFGRFGEVPKLAEGAPLERE